MNFEETIKETIIDLLNKMNFKGEVEVDASDKNNILANVRTEQAGFLIGQSGVNLEALQHLIRMIINRKSNQLVYFVLDVNNYKKYRIELLRELAKDVAKQVLSEKVAVTLRPMSAYDRRVIHLALAGDSQITTESVGDGTERKVIIKSLSAK
jgi:spoIIIJ-associated protein